MRKLIFVSGSRADYNKISTIVKFLANFNEITILLVDMHNDKTYGNTGRYVIDDLKNCQNVKICSVGECQTTNTLNYLGNLIQKLNYFFEYNDHFDMTFVHGDRISALAGAIVSNYHLTPVCQIEAGDVSGNIDECIRHSITKFSHRFLVTDEVCKKRVEQLGEDPNSIFNIGFTSVFENGMVLTDSNLSHELGNKYAILLYHPLFNKTNEENVANFNYIIQTLKRCFNGKILLIQCNNDPGGELILKQYELEKKDSKVIFRDNIPPEKFYYILKNSCFVIGNSSCGICEAPFFGVPSIDVGNRQKGRTIGKNLKSVFHIEEQSNQLEELIAYVTTNNRFEKIKTNSKQQFENLLDTIFNDNFFNVKLEKNFIMR